MAKLLDHTTDRRTLLIAAAAAIAGVTGLAAALLRNGGKSAGATPTHTVPAGAATEAPTEVPTESVATAPTGSDGVHTLQAVPAGMALVTSPRLPLFGVGSTQIPNLLA